MADQSAGYLCEHLNRKGIRPMEDVLVVGTDRENFQHHFDPMPVLVDIKANAIGQMAVQLLISRIQQPDVPRVVQLVEPELVLPEDTGD